MTSAFDFLLISIVSCFSYKHKEVDIETSFNSYTWSKDLELLSFENKTD